MLRSGDPATISSSGHTWVSFGDGLITPKIFDHGSSIFPPHASSFSSSFLPAKTFRFGGTLEDPGCSTYTCLNCWTDRGFWHWSLSLTIWMVWPKQEETMAHLTRQKAATVVPASGVFAPPAGATEYFSLGWASVPAWYRPSV